MNGLPLPLADLAGLISTVLFIVFVLLSALSHMVKSRDNPQPPRPQPRPQPPANRDPLQAELNEFLEGAQRRRTVQPQPPAVPPIPGTRPGYPPPLRPAPVRPTEEPLDAEVLEIVEGPPEQGPPRGVPVGVQVPGGRPAPGQPPTTTITVLGVLTPGNVAGNLAAMLSNPASLQQAILLSEILKRPEERWDS